MKLTFIHDHIFVKDSIGNYYSTGKLPYRSWQRYIEHNHNLTVIGRVEKRINVDGLERSSGENVDFFCVPSISSPKDLVKNRQSVKKLMTGKIKDSDVLIIRLPSVLGNLAVSIAEKENIPYSLEVVGDAWNAYWNYGNIVGKALAPIAYIQAKKKIFNAKYAMYVTENYLQNKYPTKGLQAFCSNVELSKVDEVNLENRLIKIDSEKDKKKLIIGQISSLNPSYKGIDTAIIALSKIKETIPDFEYRILGDGDKGKWARLAKEYNLEKNIFFDGTLPRQKVNLWLDQLDIYIQPSKTEGLPRAIIEAFSRACPTIASNAGGIVELVEESCRFKAGSSNELAALIEKKCQNKEWLIEQSKRNFLISKKYQKDILEEKRFEFLKTFFDNIESNKTESENY